MNQISLVCILLLGSLALNTVKATVVVTFKGEQYRFEHEPRLVEVLALIESQQNWYWPGAALYQADNIQLEKTRQMLLNNLNSIISHYRADDPKTAQSIERLQTTIKSWHLAQRLPIKIDYDLARLTVTANPRLPEGEYILDITPRIHTIQLFGAVSEASITPHLAHSDASQYISSQNLSDLANKDSVIIIQADGREITAPVAYWNKAHQEVMPGSQIFVPFKQSLFHSKLATINKQITTLALNRLR